MDSSILHIRAILYQSCERGGSQLPGWWKKWEEGQLRLGFPSLLILNGIVLRLHSHQTAAVYFHLFLLLCLLNFQILIYYIFSGDRIEWLLRIYAGIGLLKTLSSKWNVPSLLFEWHWVNVIVIQTIISQRPLLETAWLARNNMFLLEKRSV